MKQLTTLALLILVTIDVAFGQCEETLGATETVQTIQSPNYPGNYPNDVSCTWNIIASTPDYQIEVEFVGRVNTEPCCDYVEVRDGGSSAAALVANFRGNHTGRTYVSTYGSLYITFVSDESITDQGFVFRYAEIPVVSNCDATLTATPSIKFFTTPGFPNNYPNNTYCTWEVRADEGYQVLIQLSSFVSQTCCDNLLIRDGNDETSDLLADYRGFVPRHPQFLSSKRSLYLRFRSDATVSSLGFRFSYTAVADDRIKTVPTEKPVRDCGGEFDAPASGHEYFTSPGFPGTYAGDLNCYWIITAAPEERVRVWFNYIYTEACCDWIKVRDGPLANSPKIGVLRGYPRSFHTYISSGNIMRVEFDTDATQTGRGFSGFYETYRPDNPFETSCGGEYVADETVQYISTPNWPQPYEANHNCTYTIRTSSLETSVRLSLLGLITEFIFDRLSIYDGLPSFDTHVLTISGKDHQQRTFESTGPFMTVAFRSDASEHHGGFRASYTEVLKDGPLLGGGLDVDGKDPR